VGVITRSGLRPPTGQSSQWRQGKIATPEKLHCSCSLHPPCGEEVGRGPHPGHGGEDVAGSDFGSSSSRSKPRSRTSRMICSSGRFITSLSTASLFVAFVAYCPFTLRAELKPPAPVLTQGSYSTNSPPIRCSTSIPNHRRLASHVSIEAAGAPPSCPDLKANRR
jgi:hypothetical protein